MLLTFAGCAPKTQEEKQDAKMAATLHEMHYAEFRNISYSQFGYLIHRLRDSEQMGKIVRFGEDEFDVSHYNDSTDAYPYRLKGKKYSVHINPKSLFPGYFVIMKIWDIPTQNKYNE
jgi:hypothetical protein